MEQKSLSPDRGPDLPPVVPTPAGETIAPLSTPEIKTGSAVERQEQQSEAVHAAGGAAIPSVALPTTLVPPVADDATTDPQQPQSDAPAMAGDDELIEKEWVEKAKKVIAETKDDPYRREQEVTRLQADYLLKRYGRELGSL